MRPPIDELLDTIINQQAKEKGITRHELSQPQAFALLLRAWSHHWAGALDANAIKILVNQIFQGNIIPTWSKALAHFFPAAEKLMRQAQAVPDSCPELATALNMSSKHDIEALLAILHDSAEYAGQDEWDSLFNFSD